MNTYIALLRGINVSGHKKILMADLQILFKSLSFSAVQTYIQSGNVVFKSDNNDIPELISMIEKAVKAKYAFDVPVQLVTKQKLLKVVNQLPFKGDLEFNRLAVTFLDQKPAHIPIDEIESLKAQHDQLVFGEDIIYMYIPIGFGKSKLDNKTLERKLKVRATSRNWNTVKKLLEMCSK